MKKVLVDLFMLSFMVLAETVAIHSNRMIAIAINIWLASGITLTIVNVHMKETLLLRAPSYGENIKNLLIGPVIVLYFLVGTYVLNGESRLLKPNRNKWVLSNSSSQTELRRKSCENSGR